MLQIADGELTTPSSEQLATLAQSFREHYFARLSGLLEAGFLRQILTLVDDSQFSERHTPRIGCVETLQNARFETGMHQLFNQPAVLAAIGAVIGRSVDLWLGNTVRRVPGRNHFSAWHDDLSPPVEVQGRPYRRAVPMSVNLSPERFEGGNLELRRVDDGMLLADVANKTFGDAILFRIGEGLQHRVADVLGEHPRVVHVGWFHALAA